MLDFGALPPEINSGRMYAGSGSGPLMVSASAWQALASQLESVGCGYAEVIAGLQGEAWSGGASTAMAAAALPYVNWVETAATKAEETAVQARAAAAAYEAAHAATVPPAQVANNRLQYETLVAANLFGHYTAQVAALEAEYTEMWAQDAQAMYGYAASSSAATQLTAFGAPPQTTTVTAQAAQSGAATGAVAGSAASSAQSSLTQMVASTPLGLQSLAAAGTSSSAADSSTLLTLFSDLNTLSSPSNLGAGFARTFFGGGSFLTGAYRSALQAKDLPKIAAEDAARATGGAGQAAAKAGAVTPGSLRNPVLASAGRSASIGGLSAPQSWAQSTPVASAVEEPQWLAEADLHAVPTSIEGAPATSGAGPMVGMNPSSGQGGRSTVNNVLRVPSRGFKMPRPLVGG